MFSGNTCDAPWAGLSPGRELANLLEDVLRAGLGEVFPEPAGAGDGLADLMAPQRDAAGLIELANACHKQAARFQALELAAMTEYRRRRRAGDCWGSYLHSEIDRFITQEISAATAASPAAIDTALAVGRDLEDRLPDVREAMLSGGADFAKAKAIGELTRLIKDPDILEAAQQRAVEWARNNTSTRLRHNLRKLVKKLDPDAVAERKRRSVSMRSLQLWENDDGTVTLAGVNLDPALAERAYRRISQLAKARRAAGDERTLDNLRADIMTSLLLGDTPPGGNDDPDGGPGGSPQGGLGGSPDNHSGHSQQDGSGGRSGHGAGTAQDENPADGPGPSTDDDSAAQDGGSAGEPDFRAGREAEASPAASPGQANRGSAGAGTKPGADAAVEVAERAARVLAGLKPGTIAAAIATCAMSLRDQAGEFPGCVSGVLPDGTTIHGNPAYRPPGSMQKHIRKRDRTCRYPNCNRRAVNCDIDHGIPYDRDGPTCPCNLHAACRGHHRQKQLPGWHLIDIYPGVIVWVAPTGNWYITTPGIEAD